MTVLFFFGAAFARGADSTSESAALKLSSSRSMSVPLLLLSTFGFLLVPDTTRGLGAALAAAGFFGAVAAFVALGFEAVAAAFYISKTRQQSKKTRQNTSSFHLFRWHFKVIRIGRLRDVVDVKVLGLRV